MGFSTAGREKIERTVGSSDEAIEASADEDRCFHHYTVRRCVAGSRVPTRDRVQLKITLIGLLQKRSFWGIKSSYQSERAGGRIPDNGDITVHLATDNALELFAPIEEHDFIGYGRDSGAVGRTGYDPSLLEGYNVIDEPKPTSPLSLTSDDDKYLCLHRSIEAYQEDPQQGACADCGEAFELPAPVDVNATEARDAM